MNVNILPSTVAEELSKEEAKNNQQTRTANLLIELSRLIATNLSLLQLLPQLQTLLGRFMAVDQLAVVEMSPPEQVLIFPASEALDALAFEFLRALAHNATNSGELVFLVEPELRAEALEAQELPKAPMNMHSVIAAPFFCQGNAGGALIVVSNRSERESGQADAQLVGAIAFFAEYALVLDRDRALDEARRRMDQMAAFNAVTSTVNEWVDVEQLARRFLAVFLNTTTSNSGLFYLLETDEQFRLVAHFGVATELLDSFRLGPLSQHPDLQRTMGRGRLLILNEDEHAQNLSSAYEMAMLIPAESMVLLPLRVKGRGIGIVMLGRTEGHAEIADREFVQGLADQAAQAIENARLFAESQRRFEEQSALRELAQRFLSAIGPDEVLGRTLDALMTLLPGDFYEVLLPDTDGTFVLFNGRGWRRGVVGRTRTASDPHLHAGYVLRAQSPVIIENFTYETRFQPSDYLTRHQVVAGVCAPMLAETRVIGLLGVYSRTPRHFTEEQSHFLYLVATQTAIALEKARHSQAAARRLDELILLNDVIGAANSKVSLDNVLKRITGEVGELLRSESVQVFFAEEHANGTQLRAALHTPATAHSEWGRVVAHWVLRNRQPVMTQDLAHDLRFNAQAYDVRACLGVPMMIGERVIGVIAAAHPEANTFDANDLRLLTTLAGQIAAAIERARLLDEMAKRLDEISAMFEFSNNLRTATTELQLGDLIAHSAVEMLKGAGASLQLLAESGEQLQVVAVHKMREVGLTMAREVGGLSWEACSTGESFAVEDVRHNPRIRYPDTLEGIHGAIVAPLRTPSGIFGTLFVGFSEIGIPGDDKVQLATTIANLAAQSLQRLRLNEQTVEQAESLAAALSDLEASYQATLLALSAALDARDRETEGHSQRVTRLALAIGRQLKLSPDELTSLERGALLHDVGKIGISDNVLLKAGPLTADEHALMNGHPRMGFEMLKGVPFLRDALPVVLHHQEMYDGSGYPVGFRGEAIPLGARIFAVADTYDAMTSTRPYHALAHENALQEIVRCRGTQFDPNVVDAFIALFDKPGAEAVL